MLSASALAILGPIIAACTHGLASASAIKAVIAVESGGDVLAIHVNDADIAVDRPRDPGQAAFIAEDLIARGHSVDLGLMQVNSSNLSSLGVTVRQMFDPCDNVAAGSVILANDYQAALRGGRFGAGAVGAALSAYNSGNFTDGFVNGYVARYNLSDGMDGLAESESFASTDGPAARPGRIIADSTPRPISLGWQHVFRMTNADAPTVPLRPVPLSPSPILRMSLMTRSSQPSSVPGLRRVKLATALPPD